MRIPRYTLPSLAVGLLLMSAGGHCAPNATKSSFFPSTPIVDVTKGNADPYAAEGSDFFPDITMKQLKFPGRSPPPPSRQQSINSAEAAMFNMHHQQPQFHSSPPATAQQIQASPSVVIPLQRPNSDENEANQAIDVILTSARTGKSLDIQNGGEEFVKVASDPVIKEQLASGNEAEARGYIRNKLCSLGLMPCDFHGPVDKQGLLPPGGGYGAPPGPGFGVPHGHGHGWGPGVPAKDVTLVQPVALKPVGHPIAAVPLDHHKPFPHGNPGFGHGKVYGPPPPPPLPPKPIYRPGYGRPPPPPGHTALPHPGKPVIEHVHHHIHHQPSVTVHGPSPYGSSVYSSEEFGLSAKNPLSVATPGGEPVKVASFIPPPAAKSQSLAEIDTNSFNTGSSRFHSASSSSFSNGFNGDYNRIEDCTCVRITQCASYDIVGQSTSGREIISGFGKPNYGQVGYGIDPRNKLASGIESNSTDTSAEDDSQESGEQLEGRSVQSSIEADSAEDEVNTTTVGPSSGEEKSRSKRDTSSSMMTDGQTRVDSGVVDEQTAASGDGNSEPRPAHGEGRIFGQLLNGVNNNDFLKNLTRFAGYDFGDDPTQLVKIENTNLRILGKLFAVEPTWGVSFGLPGGYPQAGGGYPLNPVGNYPLVNPYQSGGIPLGPISVNPLVSFQKSKDKTKTKIWRPLVNLHITPNPTLFKGIKALVKATKGKGFFGGWGAPEYNYGGGWGSYFGGLTSAVPVPYPVPVGGTGLGYQRPVHHNHDHFHHYYPTTAHSTPFVSRPSYSIGSSSASPFYSGSTGSGYASRPYRYAGGGGGTGSSGYSASYGSSVEYSPFYKLDKKGPLDSTGGSTSGSGNINTPTGGGFGSSQKLNTKRPGKVSEVSGLTPEQESLLNALLKEDEEENRSAASRFRAGLQQHQQQADTNFNKRPSGNIEFVDNNKNNNNNNNGNGGHTSSFPGSKTKFPEEPSSNNIGFGYSSTSSNNGDRSRGIGTPISFPDSRLPPNAASVSANGNSATAGGASSTFFPNERRSLYQQENKASDNSHDDSAYRSMYDDTGDDNAFQQQGSSVTFPSDKTKSTSGHIRMTREIRTQPPPPTATIDGRILQYENERQLNIGGSCPGGYVCCRNPRQNNLYKPSGSGTNNFQQIANSPFGGQNSINSFNQGNGQCGKRNARGITGRISNPGFTDGETDYGEYPWQVAILKKDGYDNVYVCGGALIDSRHIITAAHCIKGHAPSEVRVRLGEWDVNHETEFYPHVERDVAAIAIHPEFYAGNLFNDIAIVKMEGHIDFRQNPHISPVCLPSKGYEYAGQRCFVTGWGKDAFGEIGKYQNVLKEVDLPVVSNFDCEQKLKRTRLGADFVLHPGFLCAGGEAGRDACKGDGGGPLVCEVGNTWQIAGIVSWGVGCGQQDVPGVYVKVSQYNDWIKKTIGY